MTRELVCSICGDSYVDEDEYTRWLDTPDDEPIICDCCWVVGRHGDTKRDRHAPAFATQSGPDLFDSEVG